MQYRDVSNSAAVPFGLRFQQKVAELEDEITEAKIFEFFAIKTFQNYHEFTTDLLYLQYILWTFFVGSTDFFLF